MGLFSRLWNSWLLWPVRIPLNALGRRVYRVYSDRRLGNAWAGYADVDAQAEQIRGRKYRKGPRGQVEEVELDERDQRKLASLEDRRAILGRQVVSNMSDLENYLLRQQSQRSFRELPPGEEEKLAPLAKLAGLRAALVRERNRRKASGSGGRLSRLATVFTDFGEGAPSVSVPVHRPDEGFFAFSQQGSAKASSGREARQYWADFHGYHLGNYEETHRQLVGVLGAQKYLSLFAPQKADSLRAQKKGANWNRFANDYITQRVQGLRENLERAWQQRRRQLKFIARKKKAAAAVAPATGAAQQLDEQESLDAQMQQIMAGNASAASTPAPGQPAAPQSTLFNKAEGAARQAAARFQGQVSALSELARGARNPRQHSDIQRQALAAAHQYRDVLLAFRDRQLLTPRMRADLRMLNQHIKGNKGGFPSGTPAGQLSRSRPGFRQQMRRLLEENEFLRDQVSALQQRQKSGGKRFGGGQRGKGRQSQGNRGGQRQGSKGAGRVRKP